MLSSCVGLSDLIPAPGQSRVCELISTVPSPFSLSCCHAGVGGLKNPIIQANEAGEQVHIGVACDNCEQCPIVGPRYHSQVVNNYDLCERCHKLPGADKVAPFRIVENEEGAQYTSCSRHALYRNADLSCTCLAFCAAAAPACLVVAHGSCLLLNHESCRSAMKGHRS